MKTEKYLAQIFDRFNERLSDTEVRLTQESVLFVRDDAVQYLADHQCRVFQTDLVTARQFPQAFEEMLSGGPDWVHSNLMPLSGSRFLITLCTGRKIGTPQPSLNISYEPNKTAEVISVKTLVTTN